MQSAIKISAICIILHIRFRVLLPNNGKRPKQKFRLEKIPGKRYYIG